MPLQHFSKAAHRPAGDVLCPSSDLGLGNSLPLIHFWVLGHLGSSSYCDCKHQFPSLAPKGQKLLIQHSIFLAQPGAWWQCLLTHGSSIKIICKVSKSSWFLPLVSLYLPLFFSFQERCHPSIYLHQSNSSGSLTWHLFQEASSALQSKGVSLCSRSSHSGLCVDGGSEKQVSDRCYLWQR